MPSGVNQTVLNIMTKVDAKGLKRFQLEAGKAAGQASLVFGKTYVKAMTQASNTSFKKLKEVAEKVGKVEERLKQGLDVKVAKSILRRYGKEAELIKKEEKKRLDGIKKETETRIIALKRIDKFQAQLKKRREQAEEMQEHLRGGLEELRGGNFLKFGERASGLVGKMGQAMMQKGGAAGEGTASLLSKMGSLLTQIGPALATIGAVAGGLFAVIKFILDAEDRMVQFRKSMFDAGMSVADFSDDLGDISEGLDEVNKRMHDFDLQSSLNLTTDEMIKMAGALSKAGMAQKDQTDAVYSTVSRFSAFFGVSLEEMSTDIVNWQKTLGRNLNNTKLGFGQIYKAAMESGFSVKRFFSEVMEVTSALSMYNVHMTDTISLLSKVGKYLGEAEGKRFTESLAQQENRKGVLEHLKDVMTEGQTGRTAVLDARLGAQDFLDKIKDMPEIMQSMKDILQKHGMGPATLSSGKALAETLAAASPAVRDAIEKAMYDALAGKGGSNMLADATHGLMMRIAGASAGATDLQRAAARHYASPVTQAAELYHRLEPILGKNFTGINEASPEYKLVEDTLGELLDPMKTLTRAFESEKRKPGNGNMTFEDWLEKHQNIVASAMPVTAEDLAKQQLQATQSLEELMKKGVDNILFNIDRNVTYIADWFRTHSFFGGSTRSKADIEADSPTDNNDVSDQAKAIRGRRLTKERKEKMNQLSSIVGLDPTVRAAMGALIGEGASGKIEDIRKLAETVVSDPNNAQMLDADSDIGVSYSAHKKTLARFLGANVPGSQTYNAFHKSAPANDLVMQIGSNGVKFAQRVSQNDVGVFAKPGGALSQARSSGGGGSIHNYHLYGEGPGVLNMIIRAQQAGVLGGG